MPAKPGLHPISGRDDLGKTGTAPNFPQLEIGGCPGFAAPQGGNPMPFQLVTSAFIEGGEIPKLYTCEGANVSPPLEWSGEPSDTKGFALIADDPDAPAGTWNHWLLWDIPASIHALAQGFKSGTLGVSGASDFGRPGYGGPCPPRGHGPHRYFFKAYALDVESLNLRAGARRAELDRAMRNHVLAQAQLMGRYERK
jgi:Raf kinase inhibitor-like YbhB/YbcL family protein